MEIKMNLERPEFSYDADEEVGIGLEARVILYNDEWHSFDEVINQIVKAIQCSYVEARSLTFEVHVKGKAVVYSGNMQQCLKVSSVLEEIALHTQIVS